MRLDSVDERFPFTYAAERMLRRVWLILLLIAAPSALLAAQAAASAITQDWEALTRMAPRPEGSAYEKDTVAYIEARLADLGVAYTPFDFQESDFEHSFSTCLRVDIPGRQADSLLVVAPLNSPPDAAEGQDGSINIALALDLISRARQSPPPLSLTVLFLGAEYGDSDLYPMGTALFLRDFQPGYRAAVLYLDLRAAPTRVVLRSGGRGVVSPYWLVNRSVDALRSAGLPFVLKGEQNQLDRMGLPEDRTIIEPYLNAGFPSMGIEGEYEPADPVAPAERLAALGGFLGSFLQAGQAGIPDEWDRHYLLFQLGSFSLIIPERAYLTSLLGGLAGMLVISLVFRRGLRKYMRTLVRSAWAILPIAVLSFVFLFAGTYVLQGILSLRAFPDLWTHAPLEFLGLKIAVALLLYGALYPLLRRLPFPRRGSFYSASALLFLLIDIIVASAFNVSFSYYFLWALFFVFLSVMVPNRYAKVLLFLPAPFWGLRALFVVFQVPAGSFCRFLLLSPLWGNLLVAGVSLPFVLMLLRFGRLFPGRGLLRRGAREIGLAGLLLAGSGFMAVNLYLLNPFSAANPQPLDVTQTITVGPDGQTQNSSLLVTSPAPIGLLTITDANGPRQVMPATRSITFPTPPVNSLVTLSMQSEQFLRQQTVSLVLSMPTTPRRLAVQLSSPDDFILSDSSFPSVREGSREYRLLIGAFPPNPLPLQLTLPQGGSYTLTLSMQFDAPLIGARVSLQGARVNTRVLVVRTFEVRT